MRVPFAGGLSSVARWQHSEADRRDNPPSRGEGRHAFRRLRLRRRIGLGSRQILQKQRRRDAGDARRHAASRLRQAGLLQHLRDLWRAGFRPHRRELRQGAGESLRPDEADVRADPRGLRAGVRSSQHRIALFQRQRRGSGRRGRRGARSRDASHSPRADVAARATSTTLPSSGPTSRRRTALRSATTFMSRIWPRRMSPPCGHYSAGPGPTPTTSEPARATRSSRCSMPSPGSPAATCPPPWASGAPAIRPNSSRIRPRPARRLGSGRRSPTWTRSCAPHGHGTRRRIRCASRRRLRPLRRDSGDRRGCRTAPRKTH